MEGACRVRLLSSMLLSGGADKGELLFVAEPECCHPAVLGKNTY